MRHELISGVRMRLDWARQWHLKNHSCYAAGNLDIVYDMLHNFEGKVEIVSHSLQDSWAGYFDRAQSKIATSHIKRFLGHFIDSLPEVKAV